MIKFLPSYFPGINAVSIKPNTHGDSDNPRLTGPGWDHHDDVIKWTHFPRNWPFVHKASDAEL